MKATIGALILALLLSPLPARARFYG